METLSIIDTYAPKLVFELENNDNQKEEADEIIEALRGDGYTVSSYRVPYALIIEATK
jgi:hypothetical protein